MSTEFVEYHVPAFLERQKTAGIVTVKYLTKNKLIMNRTPMPFIALLCFFILFYSCASPGMQPGRADIAKEKNEIISMLDSFNIAAARADFKMYFNFYTDDAVFTGTDATERWNKKQFMAYAKPYFDKGHAWNFTSIDRHIYFDKTGSTAWFDELLNTQMKICRGSGVLVKIGNEWKVKQYVLSATIPNEQMDSVVKLKGIIEKRVIDSLSAVSLQ